VDGNKTIFPFLNLQAFTVHFSVNTSNYCNWPCARSINKCLGTTRLDKSQKTACFLEEFRRMAALNILKTCRSSCKYQVSAGISCLGAKVNYPVGTPDHIHIMLYYYY
jgi:hypothetical protein